MPKPRRRRTQYNFTPEQRSAIGAEYRAAPEGTKRQVARRYGVLPQTVVSWAVRYPNGAPPPTPPPVKNGNGHAAAVADPRAEWVIHGVRHGWVTAVEAVRLLTGESE